MKIAYLFDKRAEDIAGEALLEYLSERADVCLVSRLWDIPERANIVFPRHSAWSPELWDVAAAMEVQGIKSLNPMLVRLICQNKVLSADAFSDLPQPGWSKICQDHLWPDPDWEGKTIVKPAAGGGGRNIEVFDTLYAATRKERPGEWVLQPFIEGARSWRVIAGKQSGISLAYWRRTNQEVASVSSGAERVFEDAPEEVLSLATKMLRAANGDILGLDILETPDGQALALEANHCFSYPRDAQVVHQAVWSEIRSCF